MKRILIVADEPGWIFERHALEIKKRLTEFHIDISFRKVDNPALSNGYDLVYVMDPIPLRHGYPPKEKCIMGLRCEFLYKDHPNGAVGLYENGFPGRCVSIKDKCSIFHVVNKNQFNVFKDIVLDKPLLLARHGVDEEIFCQDVRRDYSNRRIRVGTAGRNSPNKGFAIIEKACKMANADFVTQQYGANRVAKEGMPNFYKELDVYVCMSATEGLNNGLLEAGAMGLPIISTNSGAAKEIINDGENGFIIERNADYLAGFLMSFRNGDVRREFGYNIRKEINANWTWKKRIEDFRIMFNEVVK